MKRIYEAHNSVAGGANLAEDDTRDQEVADECILTDRVRERDLDHFLLEELQASSSLRTWMLGRIAHAFEPPATGITLVRVAKSPRRNVDGRQTDVRIEWLGEAGETLAAILVENKVTDGFQDGQAESYAVEVAELRRRLGTRCAAAVLVAPKANELAGSQHFDARITIEDIAAQLRFRLDEPLDPELRARLEMRAELLDALCGKRSGINWTPATVPAKRSFAEAYTIIAREVVPELKVRASTDCPKSHTRFFDGFPAQNAFPCSVKLKHEFGNGSGPKWANLQFDGAGHLEAKFKAARHLFPGDGSISPVRSGASLMVRIRTPGLVADPDRVDEQRPAIIAGLRAVGQLASWLRLRTAEVTNLLAE